MPQLTVILDEDTLQHLRKRAAQERRNPADQAFVLIRQALGLPWPAPQELSPEPRRHHDSATLTPAEAAAKAEALDDHSPAVQN